jgi:hypothetical protein
MVDPRRWRGGNFDISRKGNISHFEIVLLFLLWSKVLDLYTQLRSLCVIKVTKKHIKTSLQATGHTIRESLDRNKSFFSSQKCPD